MPLLEGCKHEIEITVADDEVRKETERIIANIQKKARLPGFRPGKAPASLIRSKFQSEIRQDVLDQILPKAFRAEVEKEQLQVVGSPSVTDVHFNDGEPLRFTTQFEVMPAIELHEVRDLPVPYDPPGVNEEEIDQRIATIREQKAEYVNEDPRPLADGDFALVSLRSILGLEGEPIESDNMMLHIGDAETMPEFNDNLRGVTPGEEREIEVAYPEDYAQERIAGKTVRFAVSVKGLRRKELPEINDEFARDLGDYQGVGELREAVRKALFSEKEFAAQQEAKAKLVEELRDRHNFPVPETFIDRQIEMQLEQQLRAMSERGIDPRALKLDWAKIKESQREKASKDVKGSMLLEKVADQESIHATNDEVDREVQKAAKAERQPVAAIRKKMQEDGSLSRIAYRLRTEKTLNFLFEHARKIAKSAD